MKLKDLFIGGVFVMCTFMSFAQMQITWGEEKAKSGSLIDILPLNPSNFYTLRWQGNSIFGGYYLTKFDELNEVKSKKVSISVNQNIANFEDVVMVDERPAVILSNVRDGRDNIFLQQYGYDLEPRGDAKLIVSYDLIKGKTREPIRIVQSKDYNYFAIIWMLVGKGKGSDTYGYKIFDKKYNVIENGEFEIPFESRNVDISNHLLTNTGHYFFLLKEYDVDQNTRNSKVNTFKALHLYQVDEDGLTHYKVPMAGKRPDAISMNSDDSTLFTLTGCYGTDNSEGITGVFYMKLDFLNASIIDEGYKAFDREFITMDWSEKEISKMERKLQSGGSEPSLYNYKMRQSEILPDGSLIGLMEQYYVQVRSYYDPRGMATYNYTYYYNDLIVFKVDPEGDVAWINKIPKRQISTNDGGPYSSYAFFVDNNNINIIFNDHIDNYDAAGKYIPFATNVASFTKKFNVVALTKVDLFSGLNTRTQLTTSKEIGAVAMPKLFKIDGNNQEMIIFSIYKSKEKFGVLKF